MLEQDAVVIVVIAARAALIPPLVQEASSPLDFNLHIGQLLIYPTALFTTWTSNLCTCSSSGVNLFDIAQYHVEMFIECKYMASQRSTNAVDVANHDAHPLLLRMDISKQSKRSLVKSIGERREGSGDGNFVYGSGGSSSSLLSSGRSSRGRSLRRLQILRILSR